MPQARRSTIVWALATSILVGAVAAGSIALWRNRSSPWAAEPRAVLRAALDDTGPYLILTTERAATEYGEAIEAARALHPEALRHTFDPGDLEELRSRLQRTRPRYALIFLLPDELEVNLAWRWLELSSALDEDPFVDLRTGFVTGETPAAALAFVRRITAFAHGKLPMPRRLVDNLGPNHQAPRGSCTTTPQSIMVPVYGDAVEVRTISHGLEGFTEDRLELLRDGGLIHYGGHGYPDRVVDSLSGRWVRKVRFAPSVFFQGACYTGVTSRWYDVSSGTVQAEEVGGSDAFSLGVLQSGPVAYLAALHADHGIPVYQEMEYLAYTGAPLGEVIKHTHDGVMLARGGEHRARAVLRDGEPAPSWSPAEVMLHGTASRVLFGDPALIVLAPFTEPPFVVRCDAAETHLKVTATVANPKLKSTFTETYHRDLSAPQPFDDRALLRCRLPDGWTGVAHLDGLSVTADDRTLPSKLVGFAVEQDGGQRYLHVLVDVVSTGYQAGPLRQRGATIELEAFGPDHASGPPAPR